MIHRIAATGQKLDVSGLNEITVLVDRGETALTEVAMNKWAPGLDGPPHAHDRKEQNFLVTSGIGQVKVGDEIFPASPGCFFYLPAGVIHQSITKGAERLTYFLFNAFLDADKEGHKSFAEHIALVKETRKQQAESQRADVHAGAVVLAPKPRPGLCIDTTKLKAEQTTLLPRSATERCEAIHHRVTARATREIPADATKEQTLFFMRGSGTVTASGKTAEVGPIQVVYLSKGVAAKVSAGADGLEFVSFGTILTK